MSNDRIGNLMIGRRRLLTLTAAGVSAAAIGGFAGMPARSCRRAGPLGVAARHHRGARRLSLLGRQEVRLFRRHRDHARARAVRCDRHGEARRSESGRCRLSLARRLLARAGPGHTAGLGVPHGRQRRVRFRLPQGRGAARTSRRSKARPSCSAAPAGNRSPIRCSRRRVSTSPRSNMSMPAGRPGAPRWPRARAIRR